MAHYITILRSQLLTALRNKDYEYAAELIDELDQLGLDDGRLDQIDHGFGEEI
jgi:protein-arginine kinase activator protein McsA